MKSVFNLYVIVHNKGGGESGGGYSMSPYHKMNVIETFLDWQKAFVDIYVIKMYFSVIGNILRDYITTKKYCDIP